MKYPKAAAHIGYNGDNVWLEPLQPYEDDALIVEAHPELFTDTPPPGVEAPKRKPGRPLGSKSRPKDDE